MECLDPAWSRDDKSLRLATMPEGAGSTGNVADNPDLGIVMEKENRGSEGRSLNDNGDHSIDEELNQIFENGDLREEESNKDNIKGENGTCILSKMTISLTLTYTNSKNQESEKILKVPSSNVTTTGKCDETNSTMELTWSSEETTSEYKSIDFASDNENTITFYFKKSNSVFSIDQIKADIYLDKKNFPDALKPEDVIRLETKENLSLFATSTNDRYVCNVIVFVTEKNFEFSITEVNLIAFNTDTDISSKSENYCVNPLTETANVGAIVGGVIGALAVIGIMGFVIWRRRRNAPVRSEVP
ncbi:hypothetical protein HZH66_012837 [Vespula vulgaris]|uniref:Lysosome-associated membrane glycoprotein 5 n=1 Tax=Vespula vulgaris TaxID=7454 RepID=A0A834JA92_VESVU|nr:hypothetical protein HZH66_012837 [Vespula vulgaris]